MLRIFKRLFRIFFPKKQSKSLSDIHDIIAEDLLSHDGYCCSTVCEVEEYNKKNVLVKHSKIVVTFSKETPSYEPSMIKARFKYLFTRDQVDDLRIVIANHECKFVLQ